MKKLTIKVISVAILMCLFFSLTACSNIQGYESEFIRTNRFFSSQNNHGNETSNFLIKTHDEMEQLLQDIRDEFETGIDEYLQEYLDETISLFEKYDTKFFENSNLILVGIEETSGSTRHKILSVNVFDDKITIKIKRISPNIGTCDMAYWHLFLTVSKSDFNGNTVEIKF